MTMPEVNDDRYDLLKETTDLVYDDCKIRMEAAKVKATGELEGMLAGMTKDEADEVKNAFEQLSEDWEAKREAIYQQKIEEIDKAHFDNHKANRLRLAVEEAVGNIIDYSDATEFTMSTDISDGQLSITITDDGKPFNPLAAPEPDLDIPAENREPGGLGIMYMRKMSDDLTYQRTNHQNILIIKMRT